ncbi:acyltransferase family protein [Bifidobacterium reuteri]|nr:acyltransferase [Bifidobacterium reuteri]
MKSNRILWVDYAKALAILGVFFMHGAVPGDVPAVGVASFDMVVFFFLSGYVFSIRKYSSFWLFLWNKIRTLVVPGAFFAITAFIIERIVAAIQGHFLSLGQYLHWLLGIIVNLRGHPGFGNIPWFLTCLFLIEVFGYCLVRITERAFRSDMTLVVIAAALLLSGWLYSACIHIVLPWAADVALSMSGFFVLGIMARKHSVSFERLLSPWSILLMLVVMVGAVAANYWIFGHEVNIYLNSYGNLICYILAALSGTWMVLAICRVLVDLSRRTLLERVLLYFGRNTLIFYCVNDGIYPKLIPWMLSLVGLNIQTIQLNSIQHPLYSIGAVLINVAICSLCAEFVKCFLPGVIGKKPINR